MTVPRVAHLSHSYVITLTNEAVVCLMASITAPEKQHQIENSIKREPAGLIQEEHEAVTV